MDPVVPSGSIAPLSEEMVLTVVDDDSDEQLFESIYDVPFVTVNRVAGELEAEVLLSGFAEIDLDRVSTALSVARDLGFTSYSRVFGDCDNVLIRFTDDPEKGLIWALESDLGLPAW